MEDTTAPEIQSLTLSSSQINLSEENSIKATIHLTDQGSGIGDNQRLNAAVRWRSPSGKQFVDASFYETSSGSNNNSIFIEDIDFNQYAEEGEWEIEYAETTDNAGNHRWLYPEELNTLSLNRPITVFRSGNSNSSSESSPVITEKSAPDNSTPTNSLEGSTDKESSTTEREETPTRSARIESVKTTTDEIELYKTTNYTTERLPSPAYVNVEINISNSEYLDSGSIEWGLKSDATCDPSQPQRTSQPIYLNFINQSPSSGFKTLRGSIDLYGRAGEWELKEAFLFGTDGSRQTIDKQELKTIGVEHTIKAGIFGKSRNEINTIENSGNASLIRKTRL